MATSTEQLTMAQQNLAAAQAAGDTAKIASAQSAVDYYQSVVNANNGIGPNDTTSTGVPNTSTSGATATPEGGWKDTSNGYTTTFNDKGELVSSVLNDNTAGVDQKAVSITQQQIQDNAQTPLSAPTQVEVSSTKVTGTTTDVPAADPTTVEGYGVNEIGATSASKVKPDGNGGFVNSDNNPVTADGLPIAPVPRTEYSGSVQAPIPQKQPSSIGQDWRVRLSLAPGANYLYKQEPLDPADILYPLKNTEGVIFPYLPAITVSYKANYQNIDIVHTNYKNWFYTNSSVDELTIVGEFTAQDTVEAKYMLAVIHFFKSVTKMFYGQDIDPRGGTPPPLCYLTGLGSYQFNNHPLLIGSFTYNLPNDVDYVRTETTDAFSSGGITNIVKNSPPKSGGVIGNVLSKFRLGGANLNKGAVPKQPNFTSITKAGSGVTYVPSKLSIQITAYPVVTRKDISERFKLNGKDGYSSGKLTKDGIW